MTAAIAQRAIREIIKAVQEQIDTLRYSHTDLIGPTKGQISNPSIKKQVERLEAAVAWMKAA